MGTVALFALEVDREWRLVPLAVREEAPLSPPSLPLLQRHKVDGRKSKTQDIRKPGGLLSGWRLYQRVTVTEPLRLTSAPLLSL